MQVNLSSTQLRAVINSGGAELSSLKNNNGIEYIWQADKTIWPRHAPVLFPIVGKLKDNSYAVNDKQYQLSQHGFARDMNFEVVSTAPGECTFRLTSDQETRKKYPFDFIFDVSYRLVENTITTEYCVKNNSEDTMLFSVGAHPGFSCPLMANESFDDYVLEFEKDRYEITSLNDGLLTATKTELRLNNKLLAISTGLFDNDALVFESNQVNKVTLRHKSGFNKITLECEGWPFFGIWSKKGCDRFVCLEPWYGIADAEDNTGDLSSKKGILSLEPGREFRASFFCTFC